MFSSKSRLTGLAGGAAFVLLACAASANALAGQPDAVTQQAAAPAATATATAKTNAPIQVAVSPEATAPASTVTNQDIQNLPQRLENLEKIVNGLQNEVITTKSQVGATAGAPKVTTKGGLKVESEDGEFSFSIFGRVMADLALYDQDISKLGDGGQLRRARLGVGGKMFKDWEYKFEADFGRDTAAGQFGIKDAFIKYVGWSPAEVTVGNFHEPVSIEVMTSSRFVTFIERSLPVTAFAPERRLGAGAAYYGPNFSVAGGLYNRNLDDAAPSNEGDQQFDVAGRVTYEPVIEKDKLIHFGIAGLFRNPSDQSVRFSVKPESNVTGVRFVDTSITPSALSPGALTAVDHLYIVNPEIALIYGPASFQGEYFYVPVSQHQFDTCPAPSGASGVAVSQRLCPDVTLTGWYAEASYFLTGESRNYNAKTAKFDRVTPLKNLGKDGGFGAVQLAARVSNISLDDGADFQKGTETDYTFGVNWHVNPYIRFMMDYVMVRNNASARGNAANLLSGVTSAGYDDPNIFEFRAQVDW